jgi:zinc transporter ZupT
MMTAAGMVQLVGEGLHRTDLPFKWDLMFGVFIGGMFMLSATWLLESRQDFDLLSLRKVGGARSVLIVLAMTTHSLPEGIAIGVGYGTGESDIGLAVAIAIAIHNIPEGLAIALALRPAGVSTTRCVWWSIFSSLPQPLAAVPSAWAVWLFKPLLPGAMGFAAGAMLFLVISELLPEASEKAGKVRAPVAFLIGVILMMFVGVAAGFD